MRRVRPETATDGESLKVPLEVVARNGSTRRVATEPTADVRQRRSCRYIFFTRATRTASKTEKPMMVDVAFKQIFGQEKNKRVNIEHISDGVDNRNAYFDLQCHSDSIGDFIVEVQVKNQEHFAERALFYSTFPITAQAPRGTWDYNLKPVFFLGLLYFSLPTSSLKEDGWVHHYSLRNDYTGGLPTDKVNYIFMEVGPFSRSCWRLRNTRA